MLDRTLAWFVSLLASVAVLLIVGFHMSWFSVNYLLLAGVALYHGCHGLHTMLVEFFPSRRAGLLITSGCILLGAGLFSLVLMTEIMFGVTR
ncbi:MAG: hypothetical protein O3B72_11210 [Proteobacteria bacterium]|nr:hypothetical protein [Pseudomonadota bacterium]